MNKYKLYINPIQEPDEDARAKMMFFNPFHVGVIEGAPSFAPEKDKDTELNHDKMPNNDKDIGSVVILSSN